MYLEDKASKIVTRGGESAVYCHYTLCTSDATGFLTSKIGCNDTRHMILWPQVRRRFCAFLDLNMMKCEQRVLGRNKAYLFLFFAISKDLTSISP